LDVSHVLRSYATYDEDPAMTGSTMSPLFEKSLRL